MLVLHELLRNRYLNVQSQSSIFSKLRWLSIYFIKSYKVMKYSNWKKELVLIKLRQMNVKTKINQLMKI